MTTRTMKALLKPCKGAALVEYGILVGLVSVAALVAVLSLGGEVDETLRSVDVALASASAPVASTAPVVVEEHDPNAPVFLFGTNFAREPGYTREYVSVTGGNFVYNGSITTSPPPISGLFGEAFGNPIERCELGTLGMTRIVERGDALTRIRLVTVYQYDSAGNLFIGRVERAESTTLNGSTYAAPVITEPSVWVSSNPVNGEATTGSPTRPVLPGC